MNDNTIEISQVSRRFGKTVALDDVSLNVPRGIVMGLIGENGAGKTTLIKHVLGLLKAKAGSARVFGLDPVRDPVGVLGRIGYLSEMRDLPEWMRISELMRYELCEAIEEVNNSPDFGAMVITGAGEHFCTGADVSRFAGTAESAPSPRLEWTRQLLESKPVVAAINGYAVGAGGLGPTRCPGAAVDGGGPTGD